MSNIKEFSSFTHCKRQKHPPGLVIPMNTLKNYSELGSLESKTKNKPRVQKMYPKSTQLRKWKI